MEETRTHCRWCRTPLKPGGFCDHCDGAAHDAKTCTLCLAGDRVMAEVRREIRRGV